MKTYLVQMEVIEGNDEFWESDPKPVAVLELIREELDRADLHVRNVKIVTVTDQTEYE